MMAQDLRPVAASGSAPVAPLANSLCLHVTLLPGGRVLAIFASALPVPATGTLHTGSGTTDWAAEVWPAPQGYCGLVLLPALPREPATIEAVGAVVELAVDGQIDVTPQALLALAGQLGADTCRIFNFLTGPLWPTTDTDMSFATGFLAAAAERDGFIEILAQPQNGGLFVQGWSQSLPATAELILQGGGPLCRRAVAAASFDRADILAPARGFCLFDKGWRDQGAGAPVAAYFEANGRLLRLDVAPGAGPMLTDAAATAHVAQMLPRLQAEPTAIAAFKRICRPRFGGMDTLTHTTAPVAVGFDAVLRAPDGTLLLVGWMLDPARQVRLALVKSLQNRYARISETWVAIPRADLNAGFADDPRFAGLLDPADVMHGFVAHAAPAPDTAQDSDLYLELVLEDGGCLFQPLRALPVLGTEHLPQVLSGLSPDAPELAAIIRVHLTRFLASVRPGGLPHRAGLSGSGPNPIALGQPAPTGGRVTALMPFLTLDELQPVLGMLAGSPDAALLDLTLITTRAVATGCLRALQEAFDFYCLTGYLVIVPEGLARTSWLDIALPVAQGRWVLAWLPEALPKSRGWLLELLAEAQALDVPGLLSPSMTYEDGSVFHAPTRGGGGPILGYAATWLQRGAPVPMAHGAAEIALIDRAALLQAGGFSGHRFSDAFPHIDLGFRLKQAGAGIHGSGRVEFWLLDDGAEPDQSHYARIMRQVDASLLSARTGMTLAGIAG